MGPLVTGVIALACVFGGALLGMFCRKHVPSEYQASESKEVVRLVMGLVVTTAAMALGLLVGSAKNFFDTQNAEMAQIAGNYILLDRVLTSYGPGASDARAALRSELADQLGESGTLERRNRAYMNIKEGVEMERYDSRKDPGAFSRGRQSTVPEAAVPRPAVSIRPNPLAAICTKCSSFSTIFDGYADLLAGAALREFRNISLPQPVSTGQPVRVCDGSLWGESPDSCDVPPSKWTNSNF